MTQSPSSGDYVIGRRSRVNATQDVPADFIYNSLLNSDSPVDIKNLHGFASEQVISVKAEICHLGPCKVIHLNDGSTLKKQEVVVRDTTDTITLVLFGHASESLNLNKTYVLNNVKIKRTKSCLFLNTPKDETFKATETDPFENELAHFDSEIQQMAVASMRARLLAIKSCIKSIRCIGCSKKITSCMNDDEFVKCLSCALLQRASDCQSHWIVKLLFKDLNSDDLVDLTILNDTVVELMCGKSLVAEEDVFAENFLSANVNKSSTVTYSPVEKTIVSITEA